MKALVKRIVVHDMDVFNTWLQSATYKISHNSVFKAHQRMRHLSFRSIVHPSAAFKLGVRLTQLHNSMRKAL